MFPSGKPLLLHHDFSYWVVFGPIFPGMACPIYVLDIWGEGAGVAANGFMEIEAFQVTPGIQKMCLFQPRLGFTWCLLYNYLDTNKPSTECHLWYLCKA